MTPTDWKKLKPILARKGLLTDKGHTRYATARPCPHCGATIVAGIDWHLEQLQPCPEIHADIEPLSAQGELAALMLDRTTYDLQRDHPTGRWKLYSRTSYCNFDVPYRTNPIRAGEQLHDVLVSHHCGSTLPSQPSIAPPYAGTDYNAPPPY